MTSAPRVERVDDLVVDSQGLDPPTEKWLQAAREAADTDGIRENAYAERLQMCISCCTLMCMFPMVPNVPGGSLGEVWGRFRQFGVVSGKFRGKFR